MKDEVSEKQSGKEMANKLHIDIKIISLVDIETHIDPN